MRPSPAPEPIERVLPAALLHLWVDKDPATLERLQSLAAKVRGVFPAGPGRWLVLPLPGDAAIFDRAVALGSAILAESPVGRAANDAEWAAAAPRRRARSPRR